MSNDDEFAGDISAVSYRIVYQNPFNQSKPESDDGFNLQRYGLHRAVIDPETTFGFFMDQDNLVEAWAGDANSEDSQYVRDQDLIDMDLTRSYTGSAEEYANETMNLAAMRIVDFEVAPIFDVNGVAVTVSSKDNSEIILPNVHDLEGKDADGAATVVEPNSALRAIRISITVINTDGDQLLRAGQGDLSDTEPGGFRDTYTQTYVRILPTLFAP